MSIDKITNPIALSVKNTNPGLTICDMCLFEVDHNNYPVIPKDIQIHGLFSGSEIYTYKDIIDNFFMYPVFIELIYIQGITGSLMPINIPLCTYSNKIPGSELYFPAVPSTGDCSIYLFGKHISEDTRIVIKTLPPLTEIQLLFKLKI